MLTVTIQGNTPIERAIREAAAAFDLDASAFATGLLNATLDKKTRSAATTASPAPAPAAPAPAAPTSTPNPLEVQCQRFKCALFIDSNFLGSKFGLLNF